MALVTNDEPVFESPAARKVADAGSLLDDSNPIVQANPEAFRPVRPADDEGEGRTSAMAADPQLQADQPPKTSPKVEPPEGTHPAPTTAPKAGK
jgi:hypothetical protein